MSEKLCKKCQAPLEDEALELCAACAEAEEQEETVILEETEEVIPEETIEELDEQAYIDYEIVEEEAVYPYGGAGLVLKIITAVLGVLGAIYPIVFFVKNAKDFAAQIAAAKEQYSAMNIPFEIPAGLIPAQYIVFGAYLLIAAAALVGAGLIFKKKAAALSSMLLGFAASWGVITGVPNLLANILMYQEGQEPITFASPLVMISLSGILLLAAAILAVITASKDAQPEFEFFDEEVVIDPLAFDDGEASEIVEEVAEEIEEVIEVNNEEE